MALPPAQDVEINRADGWPSVLKAVRDYWLSIRGTRTMPARRDLSPAGMKAQLPELLLADVIDGGRDFRYRLIGTNLTQFFSNDPTGKLMSAALAPFGPHTVERTLASYRSVVARRSAIRLTGSGSIYGQDPKLFDAWLAPLSEDDATVNMVLGTFVFFWDSEHQFRPPLATAAPAGAAAAQKISDPWR